MTTYLRCRQCGWVHFAVDQDGGDRCFRCGAGIDQLEETDVPAVPDGVTLQAVVWRRRDAGSR